MRLTVLAACALLAASAVAPSAGAATNLVFNGDFSQGNTGFISGYNYVAPSPHAMMPETVYTIASDPNSVHPYWIHQDDGLSRMIVNGATAAGVTVWQESLATTAGHAYSFSASAEDVCCNAAHPGDYSPSELEFQISTNGFATFHTLAAINTNPPGDAGVIQTATATFTASGPLEIRVVDALTGRVGNDFALDDISVTALPPSSPVQNPPGPGPVSAVPEPATWTSMILGLGAIGAAMRSRRRTLAGV